MTKTGVGVEKVHFPQNSQNLGDRKCLGKPRKSFVGLPSAKFFRPVLRDRVFQHPQAITLIGPILPSIEQTIADWGIRVDAAVAQKRPVAADVFEGLQVDVAHQNFFAVVRGFG
jgi:hypothetical protein